MKTGLRLTGDLAEKARALLGGKKLTARRLETLFDDLATRREAIMPIDQDDIEHRREPYRGVGLDPEVARQRLAERKEANEARGLNPHAPAAAEADEASFTVDTHVAPPPSGEAIAEVTVTAPDEGVAAIERIKADQLKRFPSVAESLERQALQRMPALRAAGRSLRTLEEAADVLIAELQPNHQDAIRQVCLEHDMANWVVVLGAVARMADLQELHAGEFESHWVNRGDTRVGTAVQGKEICETCGGDIPPDPQRRGRKFCCSGHGSQKIEHSDGCLLASRRIVKGQWVTVSA